VATTAGDLHGQVSRLTPEWRAALDRRSEWLSECRAEQLEPAGDWAVWLALAGRGWGKTRAGAEWCWWEAWRDPGSRTAVIAPTHSDMRDVCFEGESGIMARVPPTLVKSYSRFGELVLTNGSIIKGYSATEPNRLRGPQHHRGWCDELCAWTYPQDAWDMYQFGLRLGRNPRTIATTTPRPLALLVVLLDQASTIRTGGSTYENRENLAEKFFEELTKYEGTKLGRQELHAEILDPEDMGVYKRSWFKLWPSHVPLPKFELVIQSWDTAFTEKTVDGAGDPDPSAMTVWGVFSPRESLPAELVRALRADAPKAVMLCDATSDHLGYPDLLERVRVESQRRYGPKPGRKSDILLIEDKGSGISLRQSLRKEGIIARAYNPGNASKLQRAHATSHLPAAGLVWLPESGLKHRRGLPRDWCEPYLAQVCAYAGEGSVPHDDFVDTTTQVLEFLHRTGTLVVQREEKGQFADANRAMRAAQPNPYGQGPRDRREQKMRRIVNKYTQGLVEERVVVDGDGSLRE
jgi:phage terminase large subunit-like protein